MSSLGKRSRKVEADPVTPSKRRIIQLVTPDTTPTKASPSRLIALRRTPSSQGSPYSPTKSILRRNAVTPVVGREDESQVLQAFLMDSEQPLLYICGPPGTGKSATVSQYTQTMPLQSQCVFINCVSLKRPDDVYATVLQSIDPSFMSTTPALARERLAVYAKRAGMRLVLILDEMDYLSSSSLDTLYALFELADGKHVKIIGIANALNLTDTVLPHLQATGIQPLILRFKPYSPAEITRILSARVQAISNPTQTLVDPPALVLLGRKVANATGDIRKALDILRRAVELVEAEHRDVLSSIDANAPAATSQLPKVTLKHVAQAAAQALTAGMATSEQLRKLSLHELACLCTIASQKTTTIAETYEAYVRICKRDKMTTPLVRTEFTSVCDALVDRGMLAIPRGKAGAAKMTRSGSGQGQGGVRMSRTSSGQGGVRMSRTSSGQGHGQDSRGIVLAVSEMEVLNAIGDLGVLRRFFE